MNFETIFLNKNELKQLKSLHRKISIPVEKSALHSPELSTLQRYEFIKADWLHTVEDDIYLGTVSITKIGLDYLEYIQKGNILFWLKNAWIPIVVSLVTNLLVIALKLLLPQILQWLSSFLSKILS